MVQPCIWFKEEPSQFSMGQTAQSLTCFIIEKPNTGLDECPRILLSCFRARSSVAAALFFHFESGTRRRLTPAIRRCRSLTPSVAVLSCPATCGIRRPQLENGHKSQNSPPLSLSISSNRALLYRTYSGHQGTRLK